MKLYLVQHGEAVSKAKDPERPLTPQGRQDVARVAAFARRAGVEIHQVWHSGKRRAEETAGILAQQLEPVGGMVAREGLGPNDHVEPVAELMKRETRSLMLVGHLPFMERLAGLLVGGDAERRCCVPGARSGFPGLDGPVERTAGPGSIGGTTWLGGHSAHVSEPGWRGGMRVDDGEYRTREEGQVVAMLYLRGR
jgi:phosphohistidine phosphatase